MSCNPFWDNNNDAWTNFLEIQEITQWRYFNFLEKLCYSVPNINILKRANVFWRIRKEKRTPLPPQKKVKKWYSYLFVTEFVDVFQWANIFLPFSDPFSGFIAIKIECNFPFHYTWMQFPISLYFVSHRKNLLKNQYHFPIQKISLSE